MSLSVRNLSIRFGGVAAVSDMHLDVGKAEIIGLIAELNTCYCEGHG